MSIFKGKLQQIDRFSGELKNKPNLSIEISPVRILGDIRLRCIKVLNADIAKESGGVGGSLKRLSVKYVFFAALVRILNRFEATMDTAPAKDTKVDTAFESATDVYMSADPANEVNVDNKIRFGVLVSLVAYARAPVVTICNVLMGHIAGLIGADGALARFRKTLKVKLQAVADAAGSVIAKSRFNSFTNDHKAVGCTGQGLDVTLDTAFTAESTATAIQAAALDVAAADTTGTAVKAGLYSWFLPEWDGDTLQLFQVFSGVQSGKVLELDLEESSVYWANNMNVNGVLSLVFAQTEPQIDNELKVI